MANQKIQIVTQDKGYGDVLIVSPICLQIASGDSVIWRNRARFPVIVNVLRFTDDGRLTLNLHELQDSEPQTFVNPSNTEPWSMPYVVQPAPNVQLSAGMEGSNTILIAAAA